MHGCSERVHRQIAQSTDVSWKTLRGTEDEAEEEEEGCADMAKCVGCCVRPFLSDFARARETTPTYVSVSTVPFGRVDILQPFRWVKNMRGMIVSFAAFLSHWCQCAGTSTRLSASIARIRTCCCCTKGR